ncbi:transposase [Bradyrhizobium sp. CCBAU 25338]|jgi:transposase|uniref:transposase n=1 Tax=Bradyrhizobium sp. CCBAU 25338 TaxID=1641877 RepID=UPI00230498D8|nr:transposase [Bradyrhizobium sp. CCBAU 25338]
MATEKIAVPSFERRKRARRPMPEHLPRERIVYAFRSSHFKNANLQIKIQCLI